MVGRRGSNQNDRPVPPPAVPDPLTTVEATELPNTEIAAASQPLPDVGVSKGSVREKVRTRVAQWVIGSTILLGFALAGAYLAQAQNVKLAISGVFTPLLGVSGVIIGFYFGGKDSTA